MFNQDGEKKGSEPQWKKSIELQRDEATLRKIADKNLERNISSQRKPRPDLIDNFHWVITRFRRMKKVTQEQLARDISEPVSAIKMAEQGILPEKDYILVKKIENYLGINLVKNEATKRQEIAIEKELKFDPNAAKNLTISDLRRIKEEERSVSSRVKERKEFNVSPEIEGKLEDEPLDDIEEEKW